MSRLVLLNLVLTREIKITLMGCLSFNVIGLRILSSFQMGEFPVFIVVYDRKLNNLRSKLKTWVCDKNCKRHFLPNFSYYLHIHWEERSDISIHLELCSLPANKFKLSIHSPFSPDLVAQDLLLIIKKNEGSMILWYFGKALAFSNIYF